MRAARRRFRSRGAMMSFAAVLALTCVGAPLAIGSSTGSDQTIAAAPYLNKGDRGPAVAAVQAAVGTTADGVFGRQTLGAVRSFQERNGLLVDGVVGPQTSAALGLASAPAAAPEQSQPEQQAVAPKPDNPAPQPQQQQAKPEKPAPEPQPAPQPEQSSSGGQGSSSGASSSGGGSATPGVLERIAQCESGGNPSAVNGEYRGKYQFTQETWAGVGGSGDPADASEAEQDRRAGQLLSQSGTSPWANCAG